MKVIAAILFVCAKEIDSFGYVKSVCKLMQENFLEEREPRKDLAREFYLL